jgi:hypothetical protein
MGNQEKVASVEPAQRELQPLMPNDDVPKDLDLALPAPWIDNPNVFQYYRVHLYLLPALSDLQIMRHRRYGPCGEVPTFGVYDASSGGDGLNNQAGVSKHWLPWVPLRHPYIVLALTPPQEASTAA